MMSKQYIVLLVVMTLLIAPAMAQLRVDILVDDRISGTAESISVTEGYPQQVQIHWYNDGSVDCQTQARLQLIENDSVTYTAWSEKVPVPAGETATLTAYSARPAGTYKYQTDVFHCRMQKRVDTGRITSSGPTSGISTASIATSYNTKDEIVFYLRSNTAVPTAHVVPTTYPVGWSVPGTQTSLKQGITKISLPYHPSIWRPKQIGLAIISDEGHVLETTTINLTEHRSWKSRAETAYIRVLAAVPPIL